jgi:hypothetical protein
MALEPGSGQRRAASGGEGTPDGTTVAPDDLGLGLRASLHATSQGTYATDGVFEDRLGMAVRLVEGFRGFLEVREVTELGRHRGDSMGHGAANGEWPLGEHPCHRHVQRLLDLTEARGEVVMGGRP